MTKQQKVNRIARKFGVALHKTGVNIIRNAFHLNPVEISSDEIRQFLIPRTGVKAITLSDSKYYLINWNSWKQIIETDWTDTEKYKKEKHDCDNFAFSFSSRMSEIFGLTSAGTVHGQIYYKETGKYKGGHFWNAIITKEFDGFHLYYYEPIHDYWQEYKSGQKIVMGKWEYRPGSFRFF